MNSMPLIPWKRSILSALVLMVGVCFLIAGVVGCISGPGPVEDGLELCSSDADCKSTGDAKFVCVLNVCQLENRCVSSTEVCNGKDDDCDGIVDNVVFRGADSDCQLPELQGPCRFGKKACKGGKIVCEQVVKPKAAEICGNNIDDNCNGEADENPPCACRPGNERTCYPTNSEGCKADGNGSFVCKGGCKVGKQVCNSKQEYGTCDGAVLPSKELCDGKDNDCNGVIDDSIAGLGGSCFVNGAKGPCREGKQVCKNGAMVCDQTVKPSKEICDGKADEDCDGVIDNGCNCKDGEKRSCYPTSAKGCTPIGNNSFNCKGTCKAGVQVCKSGSYGACTGAVVAAAKEACDGKDDDCDGTPDNGCSCKDGDTQACGTDQGECKKGKQTCAGGKYGPCVGEVKGTPEVCDGKDNNCDGKIDEPFSVGNSCDVGIGECKRTGKTVCKADKTGTRCDAVKGPSKAEVCNGKDDDCDGTPDNGFNLGQSCTSGIGDCKRTGKLICKADGSGAVCDAKAGPKATEVCDGKDNDCDGKVDEDPADPSKKLSKACYSASSGCTLAAGSYSCLGVCAPGKQFCDPAKAQFSGACVGEKNPTTEVPGNGIDEDCDGKDGQVQNTSCNNRAASQKWGTTMTACDCKAGEKCTARFAQNLCGAGWRVCNYTEWKARWNNQASNAYRHIAMTQTCLPNSNFCYGGTAISLKDGNSTLCQQITKPTACTFLNRFVAFVVGPASKDCVGSAPDFWPNWSEVKTNGLPSRGLVSFASSADCLDKSSDHLDNLGTKVTGVLCCK